MMRGLTLRRLRLGFEWACYFIALPGNFGVLYVTISSLIVIASEAKQSSSDGGAGLLRFARNDGLTKWDTRLAQGLEQVCLIGLLK